MAKSDDKKVDLKQTLTGIEIPIRKSPSNPSMAAVNPADHMTEEDRVEVDVDKLATAFVAYHETNLLVLDRRGDEIVRYDVVVAPEFDRHVTINRGTASPATMSCDPRCVGVASPDTGGDTTAAPISAPSAAAADAA